ncbi:MAG: ABC transporter ATP-binding protein [Elusimicrobia bacterium]|nr:ABC transporter ATP-binding protein [Elusimicrobiota bacterium]
MEHDAAVSVNNLNFIYPRGQRPVLRGLSFKIEQGEVFGLLGPNGSGKTTLFRLITTLLRPSRGEISVFGIEAADCPACVRAKIGVVFQYPALDKKLTVMENMKAQGHLYGISGRVLAKRIDSLLDIFNLKERGREMAENLSGGLRRRLEIAKGLLHRPRLLVMDEPSTGLDPAARLDMWRYLRELVKEFRTTVVLTTHLMEEAEQCGRLAILSEGSLVALGRPEDLRSHVGGDVIRVKGLNLGDLRVKIQNQFGNNVRLVDDNLIIERRQAHELISQLAQAFPDQIESVTLAKPTLEDVFMHFTGRSFQRRDPNGA